MNRLGHHNAQLFVGTEVEHSSAHNLKTLFVVGIQNIELIEAAYIAHKCEHIYFGANQSFAPDGTALYYNGWEEMIRYFLEKKYLCTLDFDVSDCEDVLECGFSEYHNFIPMVSVKLPYMQQLGYNTTIKFDDIDFAKSNPGVWCHQLHELMDRSKFTDWSKYKQDEVIR